MSGTSFDGVDVALIKTDGKEYIKNIYSSFVKYDTFEREIYYNSFFQNFNKISEIINKKHILAIEEVYKTLIIAFILVVLIIYLFLGNLKAVIVPAIALPVSLIASFLGLYIFGLSINIFVLLSFILAIGIITESSVIMPIARIKLKRTKIFIDNPNM